MISYAFIYYCSVEDMRYICEYCNRVFSRKVALKKHLESHEKTPSSNQESGEESDEEPKELEIVDPTTPNETVT